MATVQHHKKTVSANINPDVLQIGRAAIQTEADALLQLSKSLDHNFARAVDVALNCNRRVIVTGVGKSGHIGRKIAATLAATGTLSFFLHGSEASHGDLGMIAAGDVVICISNSGVTPELHPIMAHAKKLGVTTICIVSNTQSPLARAADILLALPAVKEACPAGIAPTTSTTMMIAMGDALAISIMSLRGVSKTDLAQWHPGGKIGRALAIVDDLVNFDVRLPLVRRDTPLRDVVFEISAFGKGIAGVIDEDGRLIGAITDGDLRRAFDHVLSACAGDIMTQRPVVVLSGTRANDVLDLMNRQKITTVFVVRPEAPSRPVAVAHIHDLSH